jgi:hypothetical protein
MEKANDDHNPLFNVSKNNIKFLKVEETPLLEKSQAVVLAIFGLIILTVGVLVQTRIWTKLTETSDKISAIKSLFLSNIAVSLTCCPPVIIYFILSFFLFPMSDYIGVFGCIFVVQYLDVFIRLFSLFFPLAIVLMRYLFIVKHMWVKSVGINRCKSQIFLGSLLFLETLFSLLLKLGANYKSGIIVTVTPPPVSL